MKQQAKNVSPWKLGALSALCALLFVAFACSEEPQQDASNTESPAGASAKGEIFTAVERQPEFEGGPDAFYNYLRSEMTYPLKARQMGVEGQVDVQFVIGKDGSISDVKAIKGINAECDAEAVRVVQNLPSFRPGTQNGKPVFVRMVLPIVFKLDKDKTNPDNSTQGIVIIEQVEPKNEKFKVDARYANGEWSGTVYDEQGKGIPGANIVVFGTTTGTVSDLNGTFKVKADRSQDLSVSFIGYESVKVKGR